MDYKCYSCNHFSSEEKWNESTKKLMPQYLVEIGKLGWEGCTYICPYCNYENAGYELKSEDEFLKTFRLHWNNSSAEELKGKDIMDALRRAGYGSGALSELSWFETI